jgi:tRNA pseudouridine55 synthase
VSEPEGVLLVDKPPGMTSHDVVDVVRKRLGTRKVGHAGTLDPMATGLLVLGVGRGTRLLRFLGSLPKTYEGTARLGVETSTLDAEGEVTAERPVTAAESDIRGAMSSLLGDSLQVPPAYSAVKVGGRKLYEAARRGEVLEAPARPIHVDAFELIALHAPDIDFRVTCSGGTYVRVLLADVGAALGCGAHLTRLRRTAIGSLRATEGVEPSLVETPLPLERAVAHLPRLELSAEETVAAGHGRVLGPAGILGPYAVFAPGGALIGVYEDEGPKARPQVILAPSA